MKNILDILAIVLPVLLLFLPLIRRIFWGKIKMSSAAVSNQPLAIRFLRTLLIVTLLLVGTLHYLFSETGNPASQGLIRNLFLSANKVLHSMNRC